jgi:hypothetical protein
MTADYNDVAAATGMNADGEPTLAERLRPQLGYLGWFKWYMEREGIPIDDRLYNLVRDAHGALQRLCVELDCRRS